MYPHDRPPFHQPRLAYFLWYAGTAKSNETFFQWMMLITSRHHKEKDTLDSLLLMLPSNIFKFSNRLIINTSEVLGQERFHIPLMWLVRNIAWFSDTSNSVLVDPGTIPHVKNQAILRTNYTRGIWNLYWQVLWRVLVAGWLVGVFK